MRPFLRRLMRPLLHRALPGLAATGALLLVWSCEHSLTGPGPGRSAALDIVPRFATASSGLVTITRVRVVLSPAGGSKVVADTVLDFPVGADSLVVVILVPLTSGSTSQVFDLRMAMVDAAGDTIFRGGPVPVTAELNGTPTAATISVTYVGVGANAASVTIGAPNGAAVFFSDSVGLTATVRDSSGTVIPNVPVAWDVLDTALAVAPRRASPVIMGRTSRGVARVTATLLSGPADTLGIAVQPVPALLRAVSGTGQTAAPGAALAQPIVVQVVAADSLPVRDVPVTFAILAGGGALSDTTPRTDSLGLASTNWTLGGVPGAATLRATVGSGTVTGSPLTIGAVVGALGAQTLAFTGQPSAVVAGVAIAPSVVVTARDSTGATVTAFTDTVALAIGTNPGGAALSGTLKVAAVAGVATFTNVSLNKAQTGYTLVASAPGLTSAASAAFGVSAAAASALAKFAGDGQNATVGTQPADSLAVRVTDAFGNAVSGRTIGFAPTSGGGSLTLASAATNASGVAATRLTVGTAAGPNVVTATDAGLGQSVTFNINAIPLGVSKTWIGTTTDWFTATNWSPAGVPTVTDTVFIPQVGAAPVLTAAITVGGLAMAAGTRHLNDGGFDVTVNGSYDVPQLDGGATLTLAGTLAGATARGTINNSGAVLVTGAVTLNGALGSTTGSVGVSGGTARLDLGGHALSGTSFFTLAGGRLRMANALDSLITPGSATFNGGALGDSLLTAGVMLVGGNFSNSSFDTFNASGTHTVVFNGASAQTVTMNGPGAASNQSHFRHLVIANTSGGVTFATSFAVNGNTTVASGNVSGNVTGTLAGNLTGAGAAWTIASTAFTGTNPVIPSPMTGNVTFAGLTTLTQAWAVGAGGSLTVTGAGGKLVLNGHRVTVGGAFTVNNSAALKMTNALDSLIVTGAMAFGGAVMGDTLFTAGVIVDQGATFTNSAFGDFNAAGTAKIVFAGSAAQTVTLGGSGSAANFAHFRDLEINNAAGVVFAANVQVNGSVTMTAGTASGATGSTQATIAGNLVDPTSLLWQVPITTFSGTNPTLPDSMSGDVIVAGAMTFPKNFTTATNLSVAGSGARAVLNGHTVRARASFTTQAGGQLKMTNALDSLVIGQNANFLGSGMGDTLLTAGTIVMNGPTFTNSSFDNFNAGGTNTVVFAGSAAQTIIMNGAGAATNFAHFANVVFNTPSTVQFNTGGQVNGSVTILSGAVVNATAQTVTIAGSLIDPTSAAWQITNTTLSGTDPVIPDSLASNVTFSGAAALAKNFATASGFGLLVSGNGGRLALNGHSVRSASFGVVSGARVQMASTVDSLLIGGDLTFTGASMGDSMLTAGVILAGGNWSNSSFDNFNASGTNKVVFDGSAAQTIATNGAGPALNFAHFNDVEINNAAGVQFTSNGQVNGSVVVTAGKVTGAGTVTIAGGLTDATNVNWSPTNTTFSGTNPAIPDSIASNIVFAGPIALTKDFTASAPGSLGVVGNSAKLTLNGHTVRARSTFTVASGGLLKMTNALDSLIVQGSASFAGAPMGDTLLTAGVMIVSGATFSNNSFSNFNATGTHKVVLNGGAAQAVSLNGPGLPANFAHFQDLELDNPAGVSLLTDAYVKGTLTTSNTPLTGVGMTMTVGSEIIDTTASPAYQVENTVYTANGPAFLPPTLLTNLTYTGDAQLAANQLVAGAVTIAGTGARLDLNGHALQLTGAFTTSAGGKLFMANAADLLSFGGDATFAGASMGDSLITAGTIVAKGNWRNTSFDNFNASGTNLVQFAGGAQQLTMNGPGTPLNFSHFQDIEVAAGATVSLPSSAQVNGNVLVDSGGAITGAAQRLGVQGTFTGPSGSSVTLLALDLADALIDSGAYAVDTSVFLGNSRGTQKIVPLGPTSAFSSIRVTTGASGTRFVTPGTCAVATRDVSVTAGPLLLADSDCVAVQGNFATSGSGTLGMNGAQQPPLFSVTGNAAFGGASTVGTLINGSITLSGDFTQTAGNSASSFTAPATVSTVITGAGAQAVSFATPDSADTGSHFGRLYVLNTSAAGVTFPARTFVEEDLDVANGTTAILHGTGAGATLFTRGLSAVNAVFDNASLVLRDGSTNAASMSSVTFQNMNPAVTQLTVHRGNASFLNAFDKVTFATTPTTGLYLEALDTNGGFDPFLTVTLTNASPVFNAAAAFVSLLNGALVNWTP